MLHRGPRDLLPDAIPFQSSVDEITEDPSPTRLRLTGTIAAGFMASLIVAACLTSIDIVVEAHGHLAADAPTIVLQPMERSIVRSLLVKAGDVVRKGQVVATLDPTFSQADRIALLAQQRTLRATIRRLVAELEGSPFSGDATEPDVVLQTSLYQAQQAQYASRLSALDEVITQATANISVARDEADLLTRELAAIRNVEGIRAALLATQNGSRLQFLESQAASMRAQREQQAAAGRLADLAHTIEGKRAERQAFVSQWNGGLLEELQKNRTDLVKVEDALAKAERLNDLVLLTTPEDGVVLEMAQRSIGSVVREAEPLVTLLPSHMPLIADIRLASADIGYLHPGDPVTLKIDAYPYQRHGVLGGRLRSIGQQSLAAESLDGAEAASRIGANGFHRAQVSVEDATPNALPDGSLVFPGMTLTAEMKVGSRSLISYFLSPITKGFSESLREP